MGRLRYVDALAALPPPLDGWVDLLVKEARRRRVALYLVGGPVRDLLLELPLRDVDLLVESKDAEKAEAIVRKISGDAVQVIRHERFGTLSMRGEGFEIDVAVARRETYAHAGALPRVESAALLEDLARRDFSVNTLVLSLTGEGDSERSLEIFGVPGAEEDLAERRLSILHARSFHDDPTRALRGARLGARLGFTLSRSSRSRLRDALRDGAFGAVSGDRLRREFEKLFADAELGLDPSLALRKLGDWHVLGALEPGLGYPREAAAPLRRLGRALAEPPWRLARHRPWVSGLALWLAPMAPAMRRRVLARLSVRGEHARRIAAFARQRDGWIAALDAAHGRGAVDALLGEVDEDSLLGLFASSPPTVRRRVVRWAAEDRSRRPAVSGNDLVELGLEGAAVGRVLARVRAAYLDGAVANREEALALARELARRSAAGRSGRSGARKKTRRAKGPTAASDRGREKGS